MSRAPLGDLIVVLPGITGSMSQKDGKDLWAFSGQAFCEFITTFGNSVQSLRLGSDDSVDVDELEDGIRATALMPDVHLIPGLVKIDSYSDLTKMILSNFDTTLGNTHVSNEQANLFPFPYDWRHNNSVAAHQLKRFLDRQLPLWRRSSKEEHARVILVAHSMGELIACYYLKVLDGWRDCRVLITFGRPYRGLLEVLAYLANGYKQLFLDLTNVVRTFTSIYHLLLIYRVVEQQGMHKRVAELEGIPNIERKCAQEALTFHRAIEKAVNVHQRNAAYLTEEYKIIPTVETRQPTYQSSIIAYEQLSLSRDLPGRLDPLLADGDGVVPRASAIPIELSEEYYDTFDPEQHGSLQAKATMLGELYERVRQVQVREQKEIREREAHPDAARQPAISLDLEDLYVQRSEPAELKASLINIPRFQGVLQAEIQAVGNTSFARITRHSVATKMDGHSPPRTCPRDLSRGRLSSHERTRVPPPVHDLFEIAR